MFKDVDVFMDVDVGACLVMGACLTGKVFFLNLSATAGLRALICLIVVAGLLF